MIHFTNLLALVLMALTSTACVGRFNGGGFLPSSANPNTPATFGFTGHASDADGDGRADTFRGQFQYVDRAADVNVHVDVVSAIFLEDDPFYGGPSARINGVLDTGESFNTIILDRGTSGVSAGDWMFVSISGGGTDYGNSGVLGGGNVIWLPE